jgi:hypothetical protein
LNILKLDGRGVFEISLPWRDPKQFRRVLNENGHVASSVSGQRNDIPGNRLDSSNGLCGCRTLGGGLLGSLRLRVLRIGPDARPKAQASRRCQARCPRDKSA